MDTQNSEWQLPDYVIRIAVLLIAIATYRFMLDGMETGLAQSPSLQGILDIPKLPDWTVGVAGFLIWAVLGIAMAGFLADLRTSHPSIYAVAVLIGAAAIMGVAGMVLIKSVGIEPVLALVGAILAAIDGFTVLQRPKR